MRSIKMKKRLKLILPFLSFVFISSQLLAQVGDISGYQPDVSRRGTSAGAVLEIGVGARAEAMGGAFVAIADDPSALYWNPAGIVNIRTISLQATKTNWFVDTDFNVIDLIVPLPIMNSALGFHLAMMDYGQNPVRTVSRPEGTGEVYSASDLVAGLYWAFSITPNISFGLGMKYFHEKIWHVEGSTMAVDLAILFNTPVEGLRLGGAVSNLGPEFGLSGRDLTRVTDVDGRKDVYYNNDNVAMQLATEKYPIPLLFRFGAAYNLILSENHSLQFGSNVNHPSDDKESLDLGIEAKLYKSFFLRAGYQSLLNNSAVSGLTLGGGLDYTFGNVVRVTVDYAWSDWGILSTVDRFTLGISSAL